MTRHRDTTTLRSDGGRPTPGVPDPSSGDSEAEPDSNGEETTDNSTKRTASGRRMPGVPEVRGNRNQSEDTGGESCGSGAEAEAQDEPEHDLTTAITLGALRRLEDPAAVIADANRWSDWVGVVGDVSGPELNAFFRKNGVDPDFFNDISDDPAERLAKIDEDHHFYSERRVLIGVGSDEIWAERAHWEFQPLEETAANAGWILKDEDADRE